MAQYFILRRKITSIEPHFKCINSLPNEKSLEWPELKGFADDKVNETPKLRCVLRRVENIGGKGKNAGYQHFFPFQQCF